MPRDKYVIKAQEQRQNDAECGAEEKHELAVKSSFFLDAKAAVITITSRRETPEPLGGPHMQ